MIWNNNENSTSDRELSDMKNMLRENNAILKKAENEKRNAFYFKIFIFLLIVGAAYYYWNTHKEEVQGFIEASIETIDNFKELLDSLGLLEE